MANPSQKDIEDFGTFTDTLHKPEIAEDFLKHNNYSVEKAVDEWYTRGQDPNIYKNQNPDWVVGQYGPANQVEAMPPDNWDWAPPSIHALGSDPMSRPPSRTSQAAKEHVAWVGQDQNMGNTDNDDVEMQEALERSRQDQGTSISVGSSNFLSTSNLLFLDSMEGTRKEPNLRNEVTLSELQQSPRNHRYTGRLRPSLPKKVTFQLPDESLTRPAVKILDPEPKERARGVAGEPAFLKPLPNGDWLPSLISILHSIPRCRKELLSKGDLPSEFKYSDRWWEGETIEGAKVMPIEDISGEQPSLEIIYETQRLMAFLDRTNRAYGSAEALTKLMPVNKLLPSGGADYVRFLMQWDSLAMSNITSTIRELEPWSSMFTSKMVASPQIQNSIPVDEVSRRIRLTADHFSDMGDLTLYDGLDKAILGEAYQERLLTHEQFSPVFVIEMESRGKARHVHVPDVLFVDRYLDQNADYVRSSRTLIQEEMTNLDSIVDKIARIETFRYPYTFRQGDASKLMSTVMGYLSGQAAKPAPVSSVNGDMMEVDTPTDAHAVKAREVLEQLEPIWNKLKERLNSLTEEKRECEEKIKAYSICGTQPDDPQFPASVRYQLRGVATGGYHVPTVTYAIYPIRKFGANGLLGSREEPQWWKMIYDTRYTAVIRKLRVTEKQVLEAASELNNNSLLVYTHDDFRQSEQDVQLPAQLKEFVEYDNEAFRAELADPGDSLQTIEGIPVDDDRAWHSSPDSDVSFGEPGPALGNEPSQATDPTMMDGDEGLPEKVQEMEQIRREGTLSPMKRKADEEVDSDMETMAPDSDTEADDIR